MTMESRLKPLPSLAAALLALTVLTGCSAAPGDDARTTAGEAGAPKVAVIPGDGSGGVRPDARITVTAGGGALTGVSVRTAGGTASGAFAADRASWRSRSGLKPGAAYQVTATATGANGKTTTLTSRFRTLTPAGTFRVTDVTPSAPGETVGVGAPIIVTFDRAITDRAAVERALEVKAQKPVPGAWRWIGPTRVVYRTRTYWPAHQKVRFTARLTGVAAARGVYGAADVSRTLTIGAAQISTVDARDHTMTVRRDGRVVNRLKISAGGGGKYDAAKGEDVYLTASGVHLVMERRRVEKMTSAWEGTDPKSDQGYDVRVNWAVRISASGEYVHQATPEGLSTLGQGNFSHGCVRASAAGARWFYNAAQRGDVVDVVGTARRLPWTNGWSYWQLPWQTWRTGSALKINP
ncbi:L,D-transpeptidase [Actinomadura hibisca]|uniref:L,D-transpeptidase n=1 Tax=Actinomadura hibisca TaxID=68565 RepID=UPI0008370E41|nr:Ig-like domain-containing protein [Actinomadura hibisca]